MATHGIFLATALLYLLALSSGIRVDQTESLALLRQRDQVSGSCEGCFQAKRKPGQPFEDDCQVCLACSQSNGGQCKWCPPPGGRNRPEAPNGGPASCFARSFGASLNSAFSWRTNGLKGRCPGQSWVNEKRECPAQSIQWLSKASEQKAFYFIGDAHADTMMMKAALDTTGLTRYGVLKTEILPEEDFTGSGIVMTGDMTDKGGDDDAKNLKLAHQLKQAAEKAPRRAPQVEILLGNHEFMQFENELRYYNSAMSKKEYRKHLKEFAEESGLADWPVIGIFTVPFKNEKVVAVHGGLIPSWAHWGVESINAYAARLAHATLLEDKSIGSVPLPNRQPSLGVWVRDGASGGDSVVWNRDYTTGRTGKGGSKQTGPHCGQLMEALKIVGADRMVVGHTIKWPKDMMAHDPNGVWLYSNCNGKVIGVDNGMSRGVYDGKNDWRNLKQFDTVEKWCQHRAKNKMGPPMILKVTEKGYFSKSICNGREQHIIEEPIIKPHKRINSVKK